MDLKFIRTLEMRTIETGGEQAAATMDKLAASHQKVAGAAVASSTSTERAAKSQKSLRDSVEALEKRFDPLIRAQTEFEKVERRMLAAGAAFPEQRERANAVIAKAAQHYDALAQSASASGKVVVDNTKAAVDALGKLERQFSPLMRASQDFENVKKQMATVVTADPQLQTRANAVIAQARQEYEKVAASVKNVATNTDLAAASVSKYEREFSPVIRARQEFEAVTKEMMAAAAADPKLQQRANVVIAQARQEYEKVAIAANNAGKAAIGSGQGLTSSAEGARLARHELINLSRQFQDVGVSLASGQSPLTVMVQQGSQIADVFATSTGTIRGFFSQIATGATRFAVSAAGITTGIAGIGAAFIYAASSFTSGQREIEKALTATGGASGVTRDQINEIAVASSSAFGLSVAEAREFATEMASTGRISAENMALAANAAKDFSNATGKDLEDAKKSLTSLFLEPTKAAPELEKSLRFLTVELLNNARAMEARGDRAGAGKLLLEAMSESAKEASKHTSDLSKMWTAATNAMSNYWERLKIMSAKAAEVATLGAVGAGTVSVADQLKAARSSQASAQNQLDSFVPDFSRVGRQISQDTLRGLIENLDAATAAVNRLERAQDDLNKKKEGDRLNQIATDAKVVADAIIPATTNIDAMTNALNKLRDARIERSMTGGGGISEVELARQMQAESLLSSSIQKETEKKNALAAQAAVAEQLAQKYLGISTVGATLMQQAENQLTLAKAQTGAEQIIAQEKIRQKDAALEQLPVAERLKIAADERKVSEANVTRSINDQLKALDQEYELMRARSAGNEGEVKAAQAYKKAIDSGGDAMKANQIASAVLRNETEMTAEAERQATDAASERSNVIVANTAAVEAENAAINKLKNEAIDLARVWERVAGTLVSIDWERMEVVLTRAGDVQLFTNAAGEKVQFNPAGYGSTAPAAAGQLFTAQSTFGEGGFSTPAGPANAFGGVEIRANQQGLTSIADRVLRQGGSLLEAINRVNRIDTSTAPDAVRSPFIGQMFQRLGEVDPTAAIAGIEQEIARLRSQPMTLARMDLITQLNQQLESLRQSNESLEDTMKLSLDPLFSQGHDYLNALKIGYYKAATGLTGIVGGAGSGDITPVHMMLEPGELLKVIPKGQWSMSELQNSRPAADRVMNGTGSLLNPIRATDGFVGTINPGWESGPERLPTVSNANDNRRVVNNYNTITIAAGATDTPGRRHTAKQIAQGFAKGATQAAMSA